MSTVENDLANYECETARYERDEQDSASWLAIEMETIACDKELQYEALEWWMSENGGADLLMIVADISGLVGCKFVSAKLMKSESYLQNEVARINERFAEKVRWPEYCRRRRNGDFSGRDHD